MEARLLESQSDRTNRIVPPALAGIHEIKAIRLDRESGSIRRVARKKNHWKFLLLVITTRPAFTIQVAFPRILQNIQFAYGIVTLARPIDYDGRDLIIYFYDSDFHF